MSQYSIGTGLVLGHPSAAPSADPALAPLVPFFPSSVRRFDPADSVAAFLRVYEGGTDRITPVNMSAKITDARNRVVNVQETVLSPTRFLPARAADYQLSLPLARLTAGAYLLEVEARSGKRRIQRTARFSIR